jgi:hypothetical protein
MGPADGHHRDNEGRLMIGETVGPLEILSRCDWSGAFH